MTDSRDVTAVRDALQYVLGSDIPAQHKGVLIEALTLALRAADTAEQAAEEARKNQSRLWRADEIAVMERHLRGRSANSWQQADEVLMRLAGELHRAPEEVRKKAAELGLLAGLDYSWAKKPRQANAGESGGNDLLKR